MLYIDDEVKLSAEQLFDKLVTASGKKAPISFSELVKNSVFTVNPIMDGLDLGRTRQRGVKIQKIGLGMDILANYKIYDQDGVERVIRYTRVNIYKDAQTQKPIYSPTNIDIPTGQYDAPNADLAVFIFFNPQNVTSPFHVDGSNYIFEYQNQSLEADRKLSRGTQLKDALNSIDMIDNLDLVFFAKGMGVTGASDMTEKTIRAELTEIAMNDPKGFLEKRLKDSVSFNGRVLDAVEKGLITYKNEGWVFMAGLRKGQVLCNVPRGTDDTIEYLKTFIGLNIQEYYKEIMALSLTVQSSSNADDYIRQMNSGKVKVEMPADEHSISVSDIKDFTSAELFLKQAHSQKKPPSKPKAAQFRDLVLEGQITDENVSEYLESYMAK